MSDCAPQLWLIAGGPGAGKTQCYQQYLQPLGLPCIDTQAIDQWLNARTQPGWQSPLRLAAWQLGHQVLQQVLQQRLSVCVELTAADNALIDTLAQAKSQGYQLLLWVLYLDSPALHCARLSQVGASLSAAVCCAIEQACQAVPATVTTLLPLIDHTLFIDNSQCQMPFRIVGHIDPNGSLHLPKQRPTPWWVVQWLQD